MFSKKTIDYYDETHPDYVFFWEIEKNLGIHYGYHDRNHIWHNGAVENMNRVLADIAGIKKGEKVLDAGCGIGGSCIWLAKNIGAEAVGLNVHEGQLRLAEKFAEKNKASHLTKFVKGDFCSMDFPDESFDVV